MDFLAKPEHRSTRSVQTLIDAILTESRLRDARDRFGAIAQGIPSLSALPTTPQTAPRHCEGPFVSDHIVRTFAAIDAIASGESMRDCEDIATDPILSLALLDAEEAIRDFPDVFRAFAVMHNIAKPDRLLLIAEPGSAGEKEGFVQSNRRADEYTTSSELHRYDKMRRAHGADNASWFAQSGIIATYDDADRAVIAPQYAEVRAAIIHHLGLEHAYEKFIAELCWSHDDVEEFFVTPGNESEFGVFAARAGKAGLNVEKFLDALLAIALLDHDIGRIGLIRPIPLPVFRAFAFAEHAAMPERFATREARQAHARKLRIKAILGDSGLAPEAIFTLLNTPIGPERGTVMEHVYQVIRGESKGEVFGAHADHIRDCALRAQKLLAAEGLSV